MTAVALAEWQEATPETSPGLAGLYLPSDPQDRAALTRLGTRGMVTVRELRAGLGISTTSYVGSVTLGPLTLQIRPKLRGDTFSALLGYALGLAHVELLPEHQVGLTAPAFQDLLVDRLTREADRLISRGLYRHYVSRETALPSPRGRIVMRRLARRGPVTTATLPCRYFERDENVWANRVLLAGLQLAARIALDPVIRARARRTAGMLRQSIDTVALTAATFLALERSASRLTRAYEPACALIRLLMAGQGISATPSRESMELPGFLFDMNLLFQETLGRFLRDWLGDVTVHEQHRLIDVFRYEPLFNPRRKRTPTPRPDYVLTRGGRIVAIADAKYRDLWEHDLPSGMLYQLSIYALSQVECPAAAILYPTTAPMAREARISISDPVTGKTRGVVALRPVHLPRLANLVRSPRTASNDRRRREYASQLAFGLSLPQ